MYRRALVTGDKDQAVTLLDPLIANFNEWTAAHQDLNGLYWQTDDRDGMEMSIGGSGYRATINSYMFGDAIALSKIALWAGKGDVASQFKAKAEDIKNNVLAKLWDKNASFFKVLPQGSNKLADVREEHGYTPWYFELPPDTSDYADAWRQVIDPDGFYAPFGLTTAERRSPLFALNYVGHECQWNGPSWPFATSVTLNGMANLLDDYHTSVVKNTDYFKILSIYVRSQHRKREDGSVVPWIDEDLNPDTGDWMSRTILSKSDAWLPRERGKDYNHSTFCDLVITGLVGLRPRSDNIVEVRPLVPAGTWDYFCLDSVVYHGHVLTILWDKTGHHYHRGAGLTVFIDHRAAVSRRELGPVFATIVYNQL